MGTELAPEASDECQKSCLLWAIHGIITYFVTFLQISFATLIPRRRTPLSIGPQLFIDCEKDPQQYVDVYQTQAQLWKVLRRRDAADAAFEAQVLALLEPVKMQLAEMRRDGGHRVQDPHDRETTDDLAIPPDLPPAPQIFYGRDNELSSLVGMFSQEGQAHAVLLGQDGTGKSALALALLNRTEITSKFGSRRFLVRCDASAGATDISLRLAEALGLSRIPRHTPPKNAVLSELAAHPFDSLIAFDDLDGAWTSPCTRVALEDLLADLSAIPSVSLLLTLRGFQRPRGPAYTHPFPPPLGPLPLPAARALFRAISDLPLAGIPAAELVETESSLQDMPTATDTEAPLIDSLLHHARCLPRGVVRLAQCAQYEPLPFLLARCAEEGVV